MLKTPQKVVFLSQSNYLPWKGFFDLLYHSDEFIIYDESQYTKNDWRNRNKIKTPHGLQWLTIPVYQRQLKQRILDTEVTSSKWRIKHWKSIKQNYAKAPFFEQLEPIFKEAYQNADFKYLSNINLHFLTLIIALLGIKINISYSHDYQLKGNKNERLVDLCTKLNASCYLTSPSAKNYLDESLFEAVNIPVRYINYDHYPSYPQLYGAFEHQVSILDLLFHKGNNSLKYIITKNTKSYPTSHVSTPH